MTTKRFTQEERQKIILSHIEEFGEFKPSEFVESARSENHPAHEWFTWNRDAAAMKQLLQEARQFAATVTIARGEVKIVHIGAGKDIEIDKDRMTVQPPRQQYDGGGYIIAGSPAGQQATLERAFVMLRSWVKNYHQVLPAKEQRAAERLLRSINTLIETEDAA